MNQNHQYFFREILKLPHNVGQTLSVMNELGVLGAFLQEFNDLNGFLQHGVYHCYTADEHTLITIKNVEKLGKENTQLGKIFNNSKEKEILYLALFFMILQNQLIFPVMKLLVQKWHHQLCTGWVTAKKRLTVFRFL